MTARTIMVQGTASSVGKSVLVAGLCRLLRQEGLRVAPFKSQNMALNAAVTAEGAEIGRAQAMQALAAGIEPHVDMNPILLKPEGHSRSQVIVEGRVYATLSAREYEQEKPRLWPRVCDALARLRAAYDVVVIEGAGSPAEINLNAREIVNMRVAREADASVLLVGDIDRGGVFAALVGTLALLDPSDRERVAGLLINKLRGDPTLLGDGPRQLEALTGKPLLGVIPFLPHMGLPEEDGVALEQRHGRAAAAGSGALDLAVIEIPTIANFDDFDPLEAEPDVSLRYVRRVDDLGEPHAIFLPGAKNTLAALRFLDESGLAARIIQHARRGTPVVGLCGGYQLLGMWVADPLNIEGEGGTRPGLGLLPVATTLEPAKVTQRVRGRVAAAPEGWPALAGQPIEGYEIHMGRTQAAAEPEPQPLLALLDEAGAHPDGATTDDGRVWGTYVHGVFGSAPFRRAWLDGLRALHGLPRTHEPASGPEDDPFDRLAAHLRAHLQWSHIAALVR